MVSFNEKLSMSDLSQNVQCHVNFTQRPIFRGTLQRVIFYPLKHSFEHKIAHCLLLFILEKNAERFFTGVFGQYVGKKFRWSNDLLESIHRIYMLVVESITHKW